MATKPTAKKKKKAHTTARLDPALTIHKLVAENPKRTGSKAATKWTLYRNGMTVEQYQTAGGRAHTLRWDVAHELIALKK